MAQVSELLEFIFLRILAGYGLEEYPVCIRELSEVSMFCRRCCPAHTLSREIPNKLNCKERE
jgi:hypothetical protein